MLKRTSVEYTSTMAELSREFNIEILKIQIRPSQTALKKGVGVTMSSKIVA